VHRASGAMSGSEPLNGCKDDATDNHHAAKADDHGRMIEAKRIARSAGGLKQRIVERHIADLTKAEHDQERHCDSANQRHEQAAAPAERQQCRGDEKNGADTADPQARLDAERVNEKLVSLHRQHGASGAGQGADACESPRCAAKHQRTHWLHVTPRRQSQSPSSHMSGTPGSSRSDS
jgi:hypothetical protein